jgi:hypothetical protein
MTTITFNQKTSEYNVFKSSVIIATFKESELQLVASQNKILWPIIISPDCKEIGYIVELAI